MEKAIETLTIHLNKLKRIKKRSLNCGVQSTHLDGPINEYEKAILKLSAQEETLKREPESCNLADVNNCGLLNIANEILKYEYEPTLKQDWTLTEKGKMTILHRAKSKEELINYVVSHYC